MKILRRSLTIVLIMILIASSAALSVYADVALDGIDFDINSENFTATVLDYYGSQENVIIPEKINGFTVTAIADSAFANKGVRSVSIPGTVTSVGKYAFENCKQLESIEIPSSVTEIGDYTFRNCELLKNVVFNANVEKIPFSAFSDCVSLETITLSESVESIAAYAFQNCQTVKSFPFENIKEISTGSFQNSGLQEIVFSDLITTIPMQAFMGCESLSRVVFNENINAIAFNAFRNDPNLVFGVWYDSFAYGYAIDKNIPYTLLDEVKLGDTSGDGSVNINDVTTIQRYLAELETLEGIYLHAADANQDGTVDIADATVIQMYLAEYEMEYPIGKVMTQ